LPGAFKDARLNDIQVEQMMKNFVSLAQVELVHPAMPTIDAIELAQFLVTTTKKFVKFSPGGNTVGGTSDIATVTKHEGFKWISRKHFYNTKLNPLETDHV